MGRYDILDMVDFDVILGMDWLAPYHAVLYYYAMIATLSLLGVSRIACKGVLHSGPKRVIYFLGFSLC